MAAPVIKIIEKRYRGISQPGKRRDNFRVALAVEGGGMRGVVTGGSLKAVQDLGLLNCFDVVYGASSGAYNDLYLLSGTVEQGAKLYLDYANNRNFVNFWRAIRGGPLFDIEYMFHQMAAWAPVNWQRVITSPVPLHIAATNAQQGQPMVLKNFKNAQEVMSALRSTSHVPNSKKPYAAWRNKYFVDAAIADPFCLNSALKEKSTHILVLASMPIHDRHSFGMIDRRFVMPYLSKISPHLGAAYLHHGEYSVNGLSHVWNHYDGTHISTIAPSKKVKLPNQLSIKRKRLANGFKAGLSAALNELDFDNRAETITSTVRAQLKI